MREARRTSWAVLPLVMLGASSVAACSSDDDGAEYRCESRKVVIDADFLHAAFDTRGGVFAQAGTPSFYEATFTGGEIRFEWKGVQVNGATTPVTGGRLRLPNEPAARVVTGGKVTVKGEGGYNRAMLTFADGASAKVCVP